ncbi:uncharacterized protein BCR38DRAFT_243859 [Pseudomassariella vexata]|uniref:Uncharacterized protein n=1 Tax=Pseudomassariella vexata TaxID=1141098 RepID=A0A1Y2DTK5_9PEZI|nr:uncharacterized protein BCR38DRAFT_243859 [Pseudomassariella vexata]ORY62611.1 hypothetical protein BCR38DRAFT_243859 [Pseudomassariella vexata]
MPYARHRIPPSCHPITKDTHGLHNGQVSCFFLLLKLIGGVACDAHRSSPRQPRCAVWPLEQVLGQTNRQGRRFGEGDAIQLSRPSCSPLVLPRSSAVVDPHRQTGKIQFRKRLSSARTLNYQLRLSSRYHWTKACILTKALLFMFTNHGIPVSADSCDEDHWPPTCST